MSNRLPGITTACFILAMMANHAAATVNIDFTESGGSVTMTLSGSWDNWTTTFSSPGEESVDLELIPNGRVTASIGTTTSTVDVSIASGLSGFPDVPWDIDLTGSAGLGDTVGWVVTNDGSQFRGAPLGYVAGEPLLATGQLSGTLADLGLPASGSGIIDVISVGGPENLTWGINGAVVPEPTSLVLVGACSLWGISCRRCS
ncbi:MAG: hypothetical protein AAF589_04625 [Planctomycetota bacterium]